MKIGHRRVQQIVGVLMWIGTIAVAYIAAVFLASLIADVFDVGGAVGLLSLQTLLLVAVVTGVVWAPTLAHRPRLTLKNIGIDTAFQWRDIPWGIGGFIAYAVIMILVTPLIHKIAWFNVDQPQQLGLSGMSGVVLFAGFLVLVVLTPIVEEVIFRGILQGRLRALKVPFILTAIIVGSLFAAAHGQWNVAIDVFFMSLVSSYLREKIGRLWPSIVLHTVKNAFAFYVTFVIVSGTLR